MLDTKERINISGHCLESISVAKKGIKDKKEDRKTTRDGK
jgi:hypothetical protein